MCAPHLVSEELSDQALDWIRHAVVATYCIDFREGGCRVALLPEVLTTDGSGSPGRLMHNQIPGNLASMQSSHASDSCPRGVVNGHFPRHFSRVELDFD